MKSIKKFSLSAFIASFVIFHINAQIYIGGKIGTNLADTRVNGLAENFIPEQTIYTGFTAGVMAEITITDAFSFRPELNYIQKGFIMNKDVDANLLGLNLPVGAKAKTRVNYLEVPVLLEYKMGNQLAKAYFLAGPSFGYAMNARLNPVATVIIDVNLPRVNIDLSNDIYQRIEVSGVVGAGGEVAAGNGKLFADARYQMGFTNMLSNPILDVKIKNQGFNFSAGYAYEF